MREKSELDVKEKEAPTVIPTGKTWGRQGEPGRSLLAEAAADGELQEKSWTVVSGASKKLIKATQGDLWKGILQAMGGKYELWSHYPIFPMLN